MPIKKTRNKKIKYNKTKKQKKTSKNKTKRINNIKSKSNKKTKKINRLAKIEQNSFPEVNAHKNFDYQISNIYSKAKLYKKSTGEVKRVKQKDIRKVLDNRINNIFDTLKIQTNKISHKKDFYTYSNLIWLNELKKQSDDKYYTQFDNFRITQDKVYYKLLTYTEDYIKHNKSKPLAKKMNNVLTSWKNLNSSSIKKNIKNTINTIDNFMSNPESNNLWKFLAYISTNELISKSNPLAWSLQPDQKNSKIYANYISSPQFGLYDIDIYFKTKPEHSKEIKKYLNYISVVFDICLGKNHGLKPSDVFDTEYDIILSFDCGIKQDINNTYHKLTTRSAKTLYNFDWETYAKALGYNKTPSFFITNSENYVKCMTKNLLENWTNTKWKTYWIFIHLTQMIRFHKEWRKIYYNYYEKELGGQAIMFPDDIYPIFGLSQTFNSFLTKQYIEHNYREDYVKYTKTMADNLRELFITRITYNKWLSKKTREYAIKKLKHIDFMIAAPSKLREDPLLDYKSDDAWGNMQLIFKWRLNQFTLLDGKPIIDIPEVDWKVFKLIGSQAYVVNAYYMPIFNRIYVPLAYLQSPFIDLKDRGIEYNLAYLGFTLAHELSHSLDEMGSQYDYNGNLYNWWLPSDKLSYKKIIKDINKQYETFMGYDNLYPDVTLYIGENMADIAGIALCNDYLTMYHSVKHNLQGIAISFLSFKLFYHFYAGQMRQHLSEKAFKMQLVTNPHPLDKYRTNCPLARLEMFKKIYKIEKNDKMYWGSSNTIW
jgi:putative endopeptidase